MTIAGWRVARRKFCETPHTPFDGEGAARHGARWNGKGTRAAYAGSTLSLSTLEYLAHIDRDDAPNDIVRVKIEFDAADVEVLQAASYPADWNDVMSPAAQRYGDLWLAQQRSLILVVPSVLVPDELNYVINPVHPRFAAVKIGPLIDYPLDVRLLS